MRDFKQALDWNFISSLFKRFLKQKARKKRLFLQFTFRAHFNVFRGVLHPCRMANSLFLLLFRCESLVFLSEPTF
jgi:hypothetical protein